MLRAASALAVAAALLAAAPASAQHLHPNAREWRAAEAIARAYLAHETVLDLTREDAGAWGTTFWARTSTDAGPHGRMIAVRNGAVIDAAGDELVRAVLRADGFMQHGGWTAIDLLKLMRDCGAHMPSTDTTLVLGTTPRVLAPTIVRDAQGVRLVAYAHRNWGPPEAPAVPHYYVTRATLRFTGDYVLTWATEDATLDAPR